MQSTLPFPMGNVLGGGKHAIGGTDIQEFLVVPQGDSFVDSAFAGAKVHAKVSVPSSCIAPVVVLRERYEGKIGGWLDGTGL